jgi:antitoxin CcdA
MISHDAETPSRAAKALSEAEPRQRDWSLWNETNKEAIAEYNARIADEGLPLELFRTF